MTPTSKILSVIALIALIGVSAFLLTSTDESPTEVSTLGALNTDTDEPRASEQLSTPAAVAESKEAIETRVADVKPVVETREEKLAKKRAKGPFLKGRVLDPFGNPVREALVEVSGWQAAAQGLMLSGMGGGSGAPKASSKKAVRTNKEGRFSAYRDSKAGLDVSVSIGARGFKVSRERKLLGEDGTIDLGDFHLEPGAIIMGIVVNENDQPVEGADVKRTDGENGGLFEMSGAFLDEFGMGGLVGGNLTDADGAFELPNEEPGPFKITIKHKDYPLTVFEGETAPAGAEPFPLVVQMNPSASITGVLRKLPEDREKVHIYARSLAEEEPGSMLSEMLGDEGVFAGGPNCKVGTSGEFTLTGLLPDTRYELRAIEKGGMFQRKACSEIVKATAGDTAVELKFDPGASLTFHVVDASTGDPITNLKIRHNWEDGSGMFAAIAASFSDSDEEGYPGGKVVITELRPKDDPGMLEVRIESPGFLEHKQDSISIPIDADVDFGTIRLKVAPKVRIHVVEARTGKPVPRARIRIKNGGGIEDMMQDFSSGDGVSIEIGTGSSDIMDMFDNKSVTGKTDSDGWCEIPAFPIENGLLVIRSPKYTEFRKENIRVSASGTTVLNASLVRGGEVIVEVLDGSNRPVPGAVVRRRGPEGTKNESKTTDKKGRAKFRRVHPGAHSFMAEHDTGGVRGMFGGMNWNDDDDEETDEDDKWMVIAVVDGETSRLKLTAPGFCTLEGLVTSGGIPLNGATLSIAENAEEDETLSRMGGAVGRMLATGGLTDVTNDQGRYEIVSIPAGKYALTIRHPGRAMPAVLRVDLHEGENRFDATLALSSLEGRVVDEHGDPVGGAKIDVMRGESDLEIMNSIGDLSGPMSEFMNIGEDLSLRSDPGGNFVIHGVVEDTPIFVAARKDGYSTGNSKSVTVKEGEMESGLEIVMRTSGSIVVRVDQETRPFSMVQGEYKGELAEGESVGAKFGFVRGGKATLKNLRPGTWSVTYANEDESPVQLVEVRAGEESLVDLTGQ